MVVLFPVNYFTFGFAHVACLVLVLTRSDHRATKWFLRFRQQRHVAMSIFNVDKWAKNHFNSANLGDPRRTQRVIKVASHMARCSGKSIALSCKGNEADVEGAYRLIRNDNVSPEVIRAAGFRYTAELAKSFSEILAIDDTTSLSHRHQVADDLGKLGIITDKSRGWWVHSTLLLDSRTTQTIGLIHQDYWLRPDAPEDADKRKW